MDTSADPPTKSHLRTHILASSRPLAAGLAIGVIALTVGLIQPFWAGDLIERVQHGESIVMPLVVVVGLSAGGALLAGAQQLILGNLTEQSTARWRRWFLEAFMRLPLLGRQRRPAAWYSSRLVTDPPLVGRFVGTVAVQSAQSALTLVASLIVLVTIDPVSVIIPIGFAALSLVVALITARPAGRRRRAIQGENAIMSTAAETAVTAARLLLARNADGRIRDLATSSIDRARQEGTRLNLILGPITVTLMQVAYASVFVIGGWRVAEGHLGFAQLITFLMIFATFQSSLQEVSAFPGSLSECKAALDHFLEVEHIENEVRTPIAAPPQSETKSSSSASPAVEFERVGYAYPGNATEGLVDASFTLPQRKMSVFIGSSGGGKSTCLGLIEGFFLPADGTVRVFGEAMSPTTVEGIRRRIGYVDQESTLVGDTIRETLTFGADVLPSSEAMVASLHDVGLWKRLERLNGLDTDIGTGGLALSGGQRQRLAIARALLDDPDILLLDEPTSSLDGLAEAHVRRVLREIGQERTVVLTAHRLSTILEADWIVVLQDGRVVGAGTHDTLLRISSFYRELIAAQSTTLETLTT
jgi:ABC-type multidrug transport system fused ATPase/permease subunit